MTATIVPAPTEGTAYLTDSLGNGQTIARVAASRLGGREVATFAVVPEAVGDRLPTTFDRALGAAPAPVFERLVQELVVRFPSARLVVALPLAKANDAVLASAPGTVATCGDELSVVVDLAAGSATVEKALRLADPSYNYCVVVVDVGASTPATSCPADLLANGSYRLRAAVVGPMTARGSSSVRSDAALANTGSLRRLDRLQPDRQMRGRRRSRRGDHRRDHGRSSSGRTNPWVNLLWHRLGESIATSASAHHPLSDDAGRLARHG